MKLIKIRNFAIGLAAITLALVQFGCEQDWQKDLESSVLATANTATVSVSSIEDSTAIVNYSLSTVGRIFIAVVPGNNETVTPDAQDILKLSVADAVFAEQIIMNDAAVLVGSISVPELVQNTSYKVYALPVNTDGVLGTVVTTDAFSTSDTYEPTLDLDEGINPAISSTAKQTIDFAITLTFDEPVLLASGFDIQLGYRDPITEVITWVPVLADSISVSGSEVTIEQMQELLYGQYVLLTIAEGAITDRSGNEFAGIISDFIDDGDGNLIPDGIYWRVAWETKKELKVLPSDTVYVTEPLDFDVIKLVYPFELSAASFDDYEMGMIKVKYYTDELSETFNLSDGDLDIDGDTLFVYLPKTGEYGSYVTISIDEGALWDVYGNDLAAVEFGDYDWFFSYGYTRDLIIGTYTVDCYNWFDIADDDTWTVTISEDSDDENSVIITGIFGVDTSIVANFDGDLATLSIPVIVGGYLVQDFGDVMGNGGDIYLRNPYGGATIDAFIESDGSMDAMPIAGYDVVAGSWVYPLIFDCYWTKTGKNQSEFKKPLRTFDRTPIDTPISFR
ncbi:MAG: Ig-like domain-containing protein [Bacteroidales bacterium]